MNKLPDPITYHDILVILADTYKSEECPRCHKNRYGLAQDKHCPDCAYTGEDENPELDRVKVGYD